jgi:hypothetical protein
MPSCSYGPRWRQPDVGLWSLYRGLEWARLLGASPPMRMTASWLRSSRVGRIQVRGARSARTMASSPSVSSSVANRSPPRSRKSAAVLAAVKGKSLRDGLRPPLTAAARSSLAKTGRDEEMSQPGRTRRWPITNSLDTNRPIQVLWPQTAVEGCLLFRRSRGMSRHLANGPRPPPLTRFGLGYSRTSAHNSDMYHSISPSLGGGGGCTRCN